MEVVVEIPPQLPPPTRVLVTLSGKPPIHVSLSLVRISRTRYQASWIIPRSGKLSIQAVNQKNLDLIQETYQVRPNSRARVVKIVGGAVFFLVFYWYWRRSQSYGR